MPKSLWVTAALLFLFLSACTSAAIPTHEAELELPQPTQAEVASVLKYHSLDTKTQIEEIDLVLNVIAGGDAQELRNLFGFTKIACKSIVNALGGPPPCRNGESEGTIVDVLPFLGSEGSYLRKDEINQFPGLNVIGLYAIYQVSDTAYSEESFPAGEYGVMLVTPDNFPGIVLQVKVGQIVRIDYIYDRSSFDVILQRDASIVLLNPNLK
ncbi:MAG: hypothetical protein ABI904_15710 [Chloroflexota bacterium]